jgi:hypothetical protein
MKEAWVFGTLDTLGESAQDVQRNEKLEEDVKAVDKVVESGALQQLCPEQNKPKKKSVGKKPRENKHNEG